MRVGGFGRFHLPRVRSRPAGRRATPWLSLDVFDTTLTRAVAPPEAIYLLLGNRLEARGVLGVSPEAFARCRRQVEADVWRREGGLDAPVRLSDFYEELSSRIPMGELTVEDYVAEELALEAALLRGSPRVERLIADQLSAGGRVCFLSDAYVGADYLKEQLEGRQLRPPGSLVLSSADHQGSKAGGGLFDLALSAMDARPQDVTHMGDNPWSDVRAPRRHGIASVELPAGRLNRFERELADQMWASGGMTAAMAGASRLARLHTPAANSHQRAVRDVAAGVAAPFLVAYVLWVLQRALDTDVDRLYFISRDGQVMADIAERLTVRLGIPIDVRYLFASRDSVNLAATFQGSEEELAWIERDLPHLTPQDLLARLDFSWEDVASVCSPAPTGPDAARGGGCTTRLFQAIVASAELRTLLQERARVRREDVLGYLAQEGLLDGNRSGLVDFGGVGSQMRALHTLVREGGGVEPRMYLVGLDSLVDAGLDVPVDDPAWLNSTECYLYDHRRGRGVRRRRGFGTCVQMVCAADHGTVTGYRRVGGRIVPELTDEHDSVLADWGLPVLRETIATFAEHLVLDDELVDPRADCRAASVGVIEAFWSQPSVDEAAAWGRFPFEGAQAGPNERFRLAYRYRLGTVARGLKAGTFPDLGWMHWYEGSLRLSSPPLRLALRLLESAYRAVDSTHHPIARKVVARFRDIRGRARSR